MKIIKRLVPPIPAMYGPYRPTGLRDWLISQGAQLTIPAPTEEERSEFLANVKATLKNLEDTCPYCFGTGKQQ